MRCVGSLDMHCPVSNDQVGPNAPWRSLNPFAIVLFLQSCCMRRQEQRYVIDQFGNPSPRLSFSVESAAQAQVVCRHAQLIELTQIVNHDYQIPPARECPDFDLLHGDFSLSLQMSNSLIGCRLPVDQVVPSNVVCHQFAYDLRWLFGCRFGFHQAI